MRGQVIATVGNIFCRVHGYIFDPAGEVICLVCTSANRVIFVTPAELVPDNFHQLNAMFRIHYNSRYHVHPLREYSNIVNEWLNGNFRNIVTELETSTEFLTLDLQLTTVMYELFINFLNATIGAFAEKNIAKPQVLPVNYPRYEVGTLVYYVIPHRKTIDDDLGIGKIVLVHDKQDKVGDHVYTVDFLNSDPRVRAHRDLMPVNEHFDKQVGPDVWYSNFKFGCIFDINEKFILKNGFLHNKHSNVILEFSKFKNKFKQNDTLQASGSAIEAL